MSLAQGNNTPTRPRIEPGSPDPESDALTTRPVRPPLFVVMICIKCEPRHEKTCHLGDRPGPTQTGLYSHRRWLMAEQFRDM